MATKNGPVPDAVQRLADVVGEKLGRPAHCRKVRNRDEWYIQDPVFSFIQKGTKKGGLGYRVGYRYRVDDVSLWFILVHSPIMADLFKRNLTISTLIEVARSTSRMRDMHYIVWSSKHAVDSELKTDTYHFKSPSYQDFAQHVQPLDEDFDFIDDLFPKLKSTKGNARAAGNTFYLKLADRKTCFDSLDSVRKVVNLTWPLFLCLYPIRPIEGRSTALARKMTAKKIPKVCEFAMIDMPSGSHIEPLCRGQIQGAHIIPDSLGGSDLPENGIWLCEYHHRMTEGKILGKRDQDGPQVKFVKPR